MSILMMCLILLTGCAGYQPPQQFYADRAQCSALGGQAQSGMRSPIGHALGELAYQDCMAGKGRRN